MRKSSKKNVGYHNNKIMKLINLLTTKNNEMQKKTERGNAERILKFT